MKSTGESVQLEGAIYALQNQLNLSVHIGGKSALGLLGKAHFLEFDKKDSRYLVRGKNYFQSGF
ncbi:MAG: AbiEi antitoxin N-terminal domain-containing protein [Flavobacteriales bacterium]|nr:AbiEi antitoxin N-terminal domain-containing protein [Flavobacteriales bacterium]MBS4042164.1 AbiEi antitoxin N-terminal domain-containing protein [Flavobacteriales bacterium]